MLVPQYECVYVFSDYSDQHMIYYTDCRNMYEHHFVEAYVDSLYSGKEKVKLRNGNKQENEFQTQQKESQEIQSL